MRLFSLILILLLCLSIPVIAQRQKEVKSPDKTDPVVKTKPPKSISFKSIDTSSILVLLQAPKAYQAVGIDDEGAIQLKKWPSQTMTIVFPDDDFMKYGIELNKGDSSKVRLSFACADERCIPIFLSDLDGGKLLLTFHEQTLTGIGKRIISGNTGKLDKVPYVRLTAKDPVASGESGKDAARAPQGIYSSLERAEGAVSTSLIMDLQYAPLKPELYFQPSNRTAYKSYKQHFGDYLSIDTIPSEYSKKFAKPVIDRTRFGKANSVKYVVMIDARAGDSDPHSARVTYLKLKNKNGYEYYRTKKQIQPAAGSEVLLNIVSELDSSYLIQRDNGRNHFVDGAGDFQSMLALINKTSVLSNADTNTAKATAEKKVDSAGKVSTAVNLGKLATEKTGAGSPSIDINTDKEKIKSALNVAIPIKQMMNDTNVHLDPDIVNTYLNNLADFSRKRDDAHRLTTSQANRDSMVQAIDNEIQKTYDALIAYGYYSYAVEWKAKLLSIVIAIKEFNHQYFVLDYNLDDWARDITHLKNVMIEQLGIPATSSADDLARSLVRVIHNDPYISPEYYAEFVDIIKTIQQQYNIIHSRKPTYKLVSKQIDVPNRDVFSLTVNEASKEAKTIFMREFSVSQGFQIDFSTGFFFSGINNPVFSVKPTTYYYRDTTGRLRDTVGSRIYTLTNNLTYGTGFMLHAYTRTGHFYNAGLATGVMFDNTSNFEILLGLSVMLNTGPSRVALTGGLCWGKQVELSDYAKEYSSVNNIDTTTYQGFLKVPKFYAGDVAETVKENWTQTWFFGVTFNFASLKAKSKMEY